MHGSRLIIAAFVTVTLALSSGLSAQKITVDPNAEGARIESAEPQFDDTEERLAQKVTLEVRRTGVANILSVLSKQTGVDLRAGVNQNDWQVRDRKMNIFCKDLPLSNLMNSIARVMKFKWSREKTKSGAYAYRLYMDRKTLLDQEARQAREEERRARAEAERRQNALSVYAKAAEMSDAELANLRNENPLAYVFAASGLAKPMQGLFAEVPSLSRALLSGQCVDVAAASLSPQAQAMLGDVWKGISRLMSAFKSNREEPQAGADVDLSNARIRINPHLEVMGNAPSVLLGTIGIWRGNGPEAILPVVDPQGNIGKLFGEVALEAMETGKSARDMESDVSNRLAAALATDMKADSAPEPKKPRPDDPSLRAKIRMKPGLTELEDVLSAVADASGIAVVSDSFRSGFSRFNAFVPPDGEVELAELLERIEDGFQYDWDKPGAALEFRDKKWFARRAAQIPDAWIEAWREKLKKTGMLELEDIAQICSLTPEQFDENIRGDTVLLESGVTASYYIHRDLLRLYACLTEPQRTAASSEAGLNLSFLSPEQWEKATKALSSANPALLQDQSGPLVLHIKTERSSFFLDPPEVPERRKKDLLRWEFSIAASDKGKDEASWTVIAPQYASLIDPRSRKTLETQVK